MATFCKNCNFPIDESKELETGRQPCPVCGSRSRKVEMLLEDKLVAGTSLGAKGYAAGKSRRKGLLFETKEGDFYSNDAGRLMKVSQLVDHKNNRYKKKVVDPLTGQTLRDVDEPLVEHQGRGSAKKRKKPSKGDT